MSKNPELEGEEMTSFSVYDFVICMYTHTTEKCQKGLLAKIDTPKVRYLFEKLQALSPKILSYV